MRLGLFILAFAGLFCGFDQVAYDLHNTKELWNQGNPVGAEFELAVKRWAREHRF
jgi:hypothetical protein